MSTQSTEATVFNDNIVNQLSNPIYSFHSVLKTQLLKIFLTLRYLRKALRNPKEWPIVLFVLIGAPMALSYRHKQRMTDFNPSYKDNGGEN